MINKLKEEFKNKFNKDVDSIYCGPSRVNLIGEHIDYNGGLVLPCAISKNIYLLLSKRNDNKLNFISLDIDIANEKTLDNLEYNKDDKWLSYPLGAIYILKKNGYNIDNGLDVLIKSDIPLASGLSSSAALTVLIIYALSDAFNLNIDNKTIALLAKSVENDYLSLKCGIMDQAAIALGKKNKAILLDCDKFNYKYFDINLDDYSFAILVTNKKRKLTESKYNERVDECTKALNILKNNYDINNLSNLDVSNLSEIKKLLNDDILYRRVRHIITENNRVKLFINSLKNNDIKNIGKILNDSHSSLMLDYEVSGIHLDTIVMLAKKYGAIGARMTGAGFGGSAVCLIKNDKFEMMKQNVIKDYKNKFDIDANIFLVDIADGPKKLINIEEE